MFTRSLPVELRYMILETIGQLPGLAAYSTVCTEWQAFIEKKIYRRLKLGNSCLDEFEHMVKRQRSLVKYVWLNIQLSPYTCQCCEFYPSETWISKDNGIARTAISKLFSILSTWDSCEITLEISAQSSSDSEHWFKTYCFGNEIDEKDTTANFHDPKHGWINGQQIRGPPELAILRLYMPVTLNFHRELPIVRAVKTFVVHRHCRRQFTPRAMSLLLNKLPQLENFIYQQSFYCDPNYSGALIRHLPRKLKTLSFFKDFNEHRQFLLDRVIELGGIPRARVDHFSSPLVLRSIGVQFLSVSFLIEAWNFFQARQPDWTWHNLTFLALTSSRLVQSTETNRQHISDLLQDAATAALQMPKLQEMVLWNGKKGEASAFRYRVRGTQAIITWRSLWDLELESRVLEAWEKVAHNHTGFDLRVEKELISDPIDSLGDAIYYLHLTSDVIDPVSVWQMRRETMRSIKSGQQ